MKKRILLIGSPLSETKKGHLPGVNVDIPSYVKYFRSATGGAYLEREMAAPKNPSLKRIKELLKWCDNSDLNIIVFSGHAIIVEGILYLQINDKDYIKASSLYNNSARQIIILDTCRLRQEDLSSFQGIGDVGYTFDKRNLGVARQIYDHILEDAAYGRIVICSSEIGHASYATRAGSDYSLALLQSLDNWNDNSRNGAISVERAFLNSQTYTYRRTDGRQTPQAYRTTNFAKEVPFAINVKRYLQNNSNNLSFYGEKLYWYY